MAERYRCPGCVYDEAQGDAHEGYAPGTPWSGLAEDFACPDCAVREKPDFVREPAGPKTA